MKLKDLEKRVEDLARDIAAFKKDDDWPQAGDVYWYIGDLGDTSRAMFENDKYDQYQKRKGNMYRTRKDAQTVIDIDNRIRKLTGDWVADWSDSMQCKYYPQHGHGGKGWGLGYAQLVQLPHLTYMPEEAADTILKEFTTEQLNLWGGVR